jgi:hypothetical protein
MSMLFVGSPDRTAWLFRLVYFSDADGYDLIPEYRFDEAIPLPPRTDLAGAVVQDLRVERRREEGECGGVRILMLSSSGIAKWWTVRRNEGTGIGVDEIVV